MKNLFSTIFAFVLMAGVAQAQNISIGDYQYPKTLPDPEPTVVVASSDLTTQVIFVGQTDTVQTTATYGNPAGQALAKEWHDFIGFTPDNDSDDLGWVSVNHEMILGDDKIGDGGGMTVFKIRKDAQGMIEVVPQELNDGRSGKFFNVDFVNTVGPTGMNCGGIVSTVDGRIWTAEEWFRSSNDAIDDRDLATFTIGQGTPDNPAPNGFPGFDGETMEKYQNYNYMVEIDPKQAVAIRKQYNWGRQPFEGGAVAPDNKTVYLGADATPGFFSKFVADEAGDFTVGKLYVYKEDGGASVEDKWVEIDNTDFQKMLNFGDEAVAAGGTMYNRIEWVAYNIKNDKLYFCETGRDNPSRWNDEAEAGAAYAAHHIARAAEQGVSVDSSAYWDYYGRVMEYDPATGEISVFIEGGPFFPDDGDNRLDGGEFSLYDWGEVKHLSNPDGLNFFYAGSKAYMIINEDLNGRSFGRMPLGFDNRTCELWLLDMDIVNPTPADLTRIAAVPRGAEVTGAIQIDENTMFVNSQHPSSGNPAPFDHSLTIALHGFDGQLATAIVPGVDPETGIRMYPNPVSQNLFFDNTMKEVSVFDLNGRLISTKENANSVNFSNWAQGMYIVKAQTMSGEVVSTKILKK